MEQFRITRKNHFLICLCILEAALVGKALSESILDSKSYPSDNDQSKSYPSYRDQSKNYPSYDDHPWTKSSAMGTCPINAHNSNDKLEEGSRRNARLGVVEISKTVDNLKPVNEVMQMNRTSNRKDDVQTHQMKDSPMDHTRSIEDSMKTIDNVPDHTRIIDDSMKTVDSVPDHTKITEDSMKTVDSVPDHTRIIEDSMETVDSVPDHTRIIDDSMKTVDSVPDHTRIIEDSMETVDSVPDHTRITEDSMKTIDSVPDHTRIIDDSMKTVDSVPDHTKITEDSMKTVDSVSDHTRIIDDSMKTVDSVPDHTKITEDSMKTVDSVSDHTRITEDSMKTLDSVSDHTSKTEDFMKTVDSVPDHTRIEEDSTKMVDSVPDHTKIRDSMKTVDSVSHENDYVTRKKEENLLSSRDDLRFGDDFSINELRKVDVRKERFKDENRIMGENLKDRKPYLKKKKRIYDKKKAHFDRESHIEREANIDRKAHMNRKTHIERKAVNEDTAFHMADKMRHDVEIQNKMLENAKSKKQDVHADADETLETLGELDNILEEVHEILETLFELKIKEFAKLICRKNIRNDMKLEELQRENVFQRLRIYRLSNDRAKLMTEIERLTQKEKTGSYFLDEQIEKKVTERYVHDVQIEKEAVRTSFDDEPSKDNIMEKGESFKNDETFGKQVLNEQKDIFEFQSMGIMSLIFILFAVIFVMIRLIHSERLLWRKIEAIRELMSEIPTRTEDWASPQSTVMEKSKMITLASFQAGSAQTSHKQMAESVIKRKEVKELLFDGGGTLDVKQVLVNTAADIKKIVTSLVILVFIDHNDAMKILEDPNSKIEKVKTKTVEAAMEKSDTVIIVYCWDTKSKDLDLGTLYSPRLENSLSHSLLLELRKQQSIYSIYKSFTYFQRCHLIKKLQSSLREPSKEVVLVPRNQNLQVQTSTSQNIRRRNQSS